MEIMNSNSRDRVWKTGELALLVLAAFLFVQVVSGIKSYQYIGRDITSQSTISFSGKGEVSAVPDIATFSFGVSADAKTVADAQDKVTNISKKALDILKSKGVEDKDVKTADYSVYPKYEYNQVVCSQNYCPPSKQVLTGYTVSENVTVKVRKVADAGDILGTLGGTGVTNISGLNFTIDDEDALTREARQKAIDDAKSKAVALAKDLGIKLVRIVNFSENGVNPPIYYAKADMMAVGASEARPTPEIPIGENKITSNVTITYEIR